MQNCPILVCITYGFVYFHSITNFSVKEIYSQSVEDMNLFEIMYSSFRYNLHSPADLSRNIFSLIENNIEQHKKIRLSL